MKKGFKAAIPVMIGYFPVAITFGILAKNGGITFLETISFSFISYAGASQFIGLSMLVAGLGIGEIVITTFLLNFRHFFMSASLANKLTKKRSPLSPIIGFFVTDETFSVAAFSENTLTEKYLLTLQVFSYFSWGVGTIVGYQIGNILPERLQLSMGIGLYALFIGILMPEMKKSSKAIILACMAGVINTLFTYLHIPQGWSIVLTIVIVSGLGVLFERSSNE